MTYIYVLVGAYLILLTICAVTAKAADPSKGTVVADLITATRTCQTNLGIDRSRSGNPWHPRSAAYRAWQKNLWTRRLAACRAALHERARQWNPQAWLPDYGWELARCETGADWHFTGSSSDGHFVSAFAISVQEYDRNAAYMHVRGWWAKPFPPSPWEQWQAAKGHYARFGDGWTGNCHGIMR